MVGVINSRGLIPEARTCCDRVLKLDSLPMALPAMTAPAETLFEFAHESPRSVFDVLQSILMVFKKSNL